MTFQSRLLLPFAALLLFGCGQEPKDLSTTEQVISGADTPCDISSNRAGLKNQYANFIRSYTNSAEIDHAMITFARLPKEYLDFVLTESRAQLYLTGVCQGGLTSWTMRGTQRIPTTITSGTFTPGVACGRTDALGHEMGHAAYGAVQKSHPDFEQALSSQYYYAVSQGAESQYIASYARTNREEFFAEMFDQYYCSAAAREKFKRFMPRTFAFAERFLLPPQP